MLKLLKAKPIVDAKTQNLIERVAKLKRQGKTPTLKVILVGNNPASVIYTNNKKKICEKIGADCEIVSLPENISAKEFTETVYKINQDPHIHGILIQLPVPPQLKNLNLNHMIRCEKDVDGFHPENLFSLIKGEIGELSLLPCTPKGIISLLQHYQINLEGKNVVMIGRSMIVGKPMALLLTQHHATVTLCHSKTKKLQELTKKADIVIVAIGKAKFIDSTYFDADKKTIVIDVGMNRFKNKQGEDELCGDVDFDNIVDKVAAITPVPGGVGPLTVMSVAENLINACEAL